MTGPHIDGSLYPDQESTPTSLDAPSERADYLHRVCTAWDYGVPPAAQTVALLREWKATFDQYPVVLSPAYHALRVWFGWEQVAVPAGLHWPAPRYRRYDELEGRPEDPCARFV